MSGPANPDTRGAEDEQARRWLAMLKTGSPAEKAIARRGLAQIFEARGMVSEAVGLLETNAREGYQDADLYRALARMYRVLGDEYRAASATLEATRPRSHQAPVADRPASDQPGPQPGPIPPLPEPPGAPDPGSPPPRSGPGRPPGPPRPGPPPPWRLPLRVAGWIAVIATLVGAAAVSSRSPSSAVLYLISAAALGLLFAGAAAPRRLVRLPDGPLGDGTLLFVWLLALLTAGALLPRPVATPEQPTERTTPVPVATPSTGRSPTPSRAGPTAPAPSPAP